ncbi:hypothetical protein IAU60_002103 [Kwoniella sp. DSM 27419]
MTSSAGQGDGYRHRPSKLDKLRRWSRAASGRHTASTTDPPGVGMAEASEDGIGAGAYRAQEPEVYLSPVQHNGDASVYEVGDGDPGRTIPDWGEDSDDERVDTFSWVDPSVIGTERLGRTPAESLDGFDSLHIGQPPSQGPSRRTSSFAGLLDTPLNPSPPAQLRPDDSYALLLAYQATSETPPYLGAQSPTLQPTSTDSGHARDPNPEWHEMVDRTLSESLDKDELKRQGLWWELIKGEREYVRDLKTVCDVFIQPLKEADPPILEPQNRLYAFIAEVFSTVQQIYHAHVRLLGRLMERQRHEWPLMTTATDLLLGTLLEMVDLYEAYMKNYPFAEARVRREQARNEPFKIFLAERNTIELTRRRDLSVFLSRPVTRLPRILLVLEALFKVTPPDHPDKKDIPTAIEILHGVIRSTQPGIESAENKIRLWNVAERLMFKRGEIVELDIADPKRTLVHMGYVFRRVRSETNWHGWQDLQAILLDNYFLLARDEEHGKLVVVSRPIHLDFFNLLAADGTPERRYDSVSRYQRKPGASVLQPIFQPERLMYPFTIGVPGGPVGRSYTLCTAQEWKEKIEGAKMLRQFDVEGNRTYAVHTITIPPVIKQAVTVADTFSLHGREAIAVATSSSVWVGWRRDSQSYRELVRLNPGHITMISFVPDFQWLLVLSAGTLLAYSLKEMMPTPDPSTWTTRGKSEGDCLSGLEHFVAFVRIGVTKGRLLVVFAVHAKNNHQTSLHFLEPLLSSTYTRSAFRPFGSVLVPGYASDLSFFRQTVSVLTEKTFIIAEPGNPTHNAIPTLAPGMDERSMVVRMIAGARPLGMWQVDENEFLLVYDAGACWVTKHGQLSRNGSFLRWNVHPSYAVFRHPHVLLCDESGPGARVEVRDVMEGNGKVCEVVEEKGMKVFHLVRPEQGLVAKCDRGLIELVETVPLNPAMGTQ